MLPCGLILLFSPSSLPSVALLVTSSLLFAAHCVWGFFLGLSPLVFVLAALLLALFSVQCFSHLAFSYPDLESFQEMFLKP